MTKDDDHMLMAPQMVLIGAFGRNSGKTALACRMIRAWKRDTPIYAVKVIGIDEANGVCHRGEAGCGICTSLCGSHELCEEAGEFPEKDTARMLAAGAERAFLLKSLKECMGRAFGEFLSQVPKGAVIVAESNTLRNYVVPGAFVFAGFEPPREDSIKKSAREVLERADLFLSPDDDHVAEVFCLRKHPGGDVTVQPALFGGRRRGFGPLCDKREGER